MIEIKANAKDFFFDRAVVLNAIDQLEAKAFNRIGGRIKVTAQRGQRSQKKSKKLTSKPTPSRPGQPPMRRGALGEGLTKILYHYDPREHRVVIGPVKFNWDEYSMTIPQLHEFGGTVNALEMHVALSTGPQWIRISKRLQRNAKGRAIRTVRATYPARPFMFPALEKNRAFITDSWSGASGKVGV